MNEGQLAQIYLEAGQQGPKSMRDLEDVIAVLFLQSYRQVPLMSDDAETLIENFFDRVGVKNSADVDTLDEKLKGYFALNPIRQDLLRRVVQSFGPGEQTKALRAGYAISSAF